MLCLPNFVFLPSLLVYSFHFVFPKVISHKPLFRLRVKSFLSIRRYIVIILLDVLLNLTFRYFFVLILFWHEDLYPISGLGSHFIPPENIRKGSGVVRGYKMGTLPRNGLQILKDFIISNFVMFSFAVRNLLFH